MTKTPEITAAELAARRELEEKEQEEAYDEEERIKETLATKALARQTAAEIRHGVTSDKATVPTQIRILQSQLDDLKVITGIERSNVSSIIRTLIAEYILEKRAEPYIAEALDAAAGGRRAIEKYRKQKRIDSGKGE